MNEIDAVVRIIFFFSIGVLALYAVRHFLFTVFRLRLKFPHDFSEIEGVHLPKISVVVPMHNEEAVAENVLNALVASDYDPALIEIVAVDDRSTDGTAAIIDDMAALNPQIHAFHKTSGKGKASALEFATSQATGEIIIVFDADYVPGPGILKMLAAPFADPQVGAVMGRVVPQNAGASLMSCLLALERAAGYQVGQQIRFNLGLVPQFGGTVGGVRRSALQAVGGWNVNSLTEDTDVTCRLVLQGWKIAYINRAECYEQVPQSWKVRKTQLKRWVMGHNDCFHRFGMAALRSSALTFRARIDMFMMLACYWTAPLLIAGCAASLILFFRHQALPVETIAAATLLIGCQMFANQASFTEIAAASYLDRQPLRILLLPLTILSFTASTGAICSALIKYYSTTLFGLRKSGWHKTVRYPSNGNGNGNAHKNGSSNGNKNGNGHNGGQH